MKSIIQKDKDRCYICGKNGNIDPLDEHHVYAGANRKLSEQYGLKVYLCHNSCHLYGVHKDGDMALELKKNVQEKAMKYYGWTVDDFIAIFGKSYI